MNIYVGLVVFAGQLGILGVDALDNRRYTMSSCPTSPTFHGQIVAKSTRVLVLCRNNAKSLLKGRSLVLALSSLVEQHCVMYDTGAGYVVEIKAYEPKFPTGMAYVGGYELECPKAVPPTTTPVPTTTTPVPTTTTPVPTTTTPRPTTTTPRPTTTTPRPTTTTPRPTTTTPRPTTTTLEPTTTTPQPTTNPTTAVKTDEPIVHLSADCPSTSDGSPILQLTADVPAYAKAMCKSGESEFTTVNDVDYFLASTFNQAIPGENCLFHKKNGSNTFTVDVEVGWGEKNGHVITYTLVKTISCAYDNHGNALSSEETLADWFLSPKEVQSLLGRNSTISFELKVLDVLDEEIDNDHISIGRKIRLMATNKTGPVVGFKALSCDAKNSIKSYAVLRAGCGDGQVFKKAQGFYTEGNVIYSPYFDAFKLSDDDEIRFECIFTVCTSRCDGSSCPTERRRRASFSNAGTI